MVSLCTCQIPYPAQRLRWTKAAGSRLTLRKTSRTLQFELRESTALHWAQLPCLFWQISPLCAGSGALPAPAKPGEHGWRSERPGPTSPQGARPHISWELRHENLPLEGSGTSRWTAEPTGPPLRLLASPAHSTGAGQSQAAPSAPVFLWPRSSWHPKCHCAIARRPLALAPPKADAKRKHRAPPCGCRATAGAARVLPSVAKLQTSTALSSWAPLQETTGRRVNGTSSRKSCSAHRGVSAIDPAGQGPRPSVW